MNLLPKPSQSNFSELMKKLIGDQRREKQDSMEDSIAEGRGKSTLARGAWVLIWDSLALSPSLIIGHLGQVRAR